MTNAQQFELALEAEAEVVRGCCGQAHEFGPCPNAPENPESKEDPS